MRKVRHGAGMLALLLAAVLVAAPAVLAAAIPAPVWMEKSAVADSMVINGLHSTVYAFRADRRLEEVLDFYRQIWDESQAGRSGYREAAVFPWHVVSRLEGRYLFTVQAREKDALSCEGYLAVADLRGSAKKGRGQLVPSLQGSQVLNDTISHDPGKQGRTLMIVNGHSVDSNTNFYRDHYLARGWGQLQDQAFGGAHVLAYRRGGQESHIVIRQTDNGAALVMNLVKHD